MSTQITVATTFLIPEGSSEQGKCAKSLMIASLKACRTGDCVDKVNGCTCDCDEDRELMLQVNGSACVARNVKISFSNEFRLKVYVRHSASRIGRNPRHVYSTEGVCLRQHVQ